MAPAKKSKSVNKAFAAAAAALNDSSPSKDEKAKQKKRKLSDMLGPQWSKQELHRFYDAYRKNGRDWKKVASGVRSRSIEMVEALFNMNRAYLSLPEGTASVAGLIAMMTDHYNVMDGSGSEKDTEDASVIVGKLQKYPKAKGRLDSVRDDSFKHQSVGSSDGCLSLLKMKGDGIRSNFPVRKRTPRVPVAFLDNQNKKSRVSLMNANENVVSHGALYSREALQSLNSPHGLHIKSSQVPPGEKDVQFPMLKPMTGGFIADEDSTDGSLGSNENLIRESVHMFAGDVSRDIGFEGADAKVHRSPSKGQRKRNKRLAFEDERVACDALQTLADLSLMMPYLATEPVEDAGDSINKRETVVDMGPRFEAALKDGSATFKKKRKSRVSKVQKVEPLNGYSSKQAEKENLADEEVKYVDISAQMSPVSKRCKTSVRSPDVSSSNDRAMGETEVAVSSTQVPPQVINPTRRKSRRKWDRTLRQKDINHASSACSSECLSMLPEGVRQTAKIVHCLSSRNVRRWCMYEWFYSAIDYPWFAKREFVEYLNHVGLGHIPRLTRVEWGVIRSSLGKPRRFSERFLQEEKEKLKQYRESVRTHYSSLRAGLGEGLPTDLARPLSVGQQVVAVHPKTREVHNGSVLTVDRQSCLVQFDRPDLGVELVMDIDCMPLNPVENMPESLRRQNMLHDNQYSLIPKVHGSCVLDSNGHVQNQDSQLYIPPFSPSITNENKVKPVCMSSHANITANGNLSTATQSQLCNMAQLQSRKGDMRPIPGFIHGSDTKALGQCNGYPGNQSCWPQGVANPVALNGTIHSSINSLFSSQELSSSVTEIVKGSRDRAKKVVGVAIKTLSAMKESENAYKSTGKVANATDIAEHTVHQRTPSTIMSSNTVQGSLPPQNPVVSCTSESQLPGDNFSEKFVGDSFASDHRLPSDLITSCVATLLMIQSCTERQYPPAEVAQILDNAVSSLHPCCPQNLSIYREIQMCMGRIKTQILALVPT